MDMKTIERVDRDLNREMLKQVDIIYGAAAIAFSRYWGYGMQKIVKIFDRSGEVWDECADYGTKVSIMQMLYEETGIEMKLSTNGKSFRDIAFFNADVPVGTKTTISKEQWFMMRQQQIRWSAPSIMASLLLTLNRYYGFGGVRLQRVMEQVDEVRQEFKLNPVYIVRACREETGVILKDAFKRGA